jgi:hypothetical protein
MQFSDPHTVGARHLSMNELTKNEQKLEDILDDFSDRVAELRRIIFDYEESSENSLPPNQLAMMLTNEPYSLLTKLYGLKRMRNTSQLSAS